MLRTSGERSWLVPAAVGGGPDFTLRSSRNHVVTVVHVARCPSRGMSPPARSVRGAGSSGRQLLGWPPFPSLALDAPPQPALEKVGMKR